MGEEAQIFQRVLKMTRVAFHRCSVSLFARGGLKGD